MTRAALVVGATGLVGGHLLARLVADDRWSRVVVLARRAIDGAATKVTEHIVDFESLATSEGRGVALESIDDVFLCLGTTIKIAGSKERFRRVDRDYTIAAARLGKKAGASRVALVSSVGADDKASTFYLRVKGETERDIRDLGFDTTILARPSVLVGDRGVSRPGERAGIAVTSLLAPLMVGGLRSYRPIDARDVASAMIEAIARGEKGARVLLHAELIALSGGAGGG